MCLIHVICLIHTSHNSFIHNITYSYVASALVSFSLLQTGGVTWLTHVWRHSFIYATTRAYITSLILTCHDSFMWWSQPRCPLIHIYHTTHPYTTSLIRTCHASTYVVASTTVSSHSYCRVKSCVIIIIIIRIWCRSSCPHPYMASSRISCYGVATMSRLLQIIGLFYRISSLS